MGLGSFLILLVIAAICGGIGQSISGYSLGGCIISIIVGFIGALIGQWMAKEFNLPEFWTIQVGGKSFPIIWAIVGSTIFSLVVGSLSRKRRENK
ncbi:MAG: hypothetical protein V1720_14785 [bacterium]